MNRERSRRSPDRRRSRSRSRSAERRRIGRDRSRSRERERRPRDHSRSPRRPRSRSPPRKRSRSLSPPRRRSRSRSPARRRSRSRSPARRTSRSRSRERDRKKRRRSRSRSSSSSSSDGDSDHGHRRHRRRSRSRSRERKEKDKKRKHRDKDKDKKKSKSKSKKKGTVASEWGKFGIINESDLYTKDPEFRTWLLEERKINPETISKDQTRKQFAKFVEDFNTGTLPHEKYYNLARYEARMSLVRSGEALPADDAGYDFGADVAAHASAIKRTVRDKESEAGASYSREELQELRRVQNERVQLGKMKVLGMDIKTSLGVRMVENDTFDGD